MYICLSLHFLLFMTTSSKPFLNYKSWLSVSWTCVLSFDTIDLSFLLHCLSTWFGFDGKVISAMAHIILVIT